jgi:hypothetical protein
MDASLFEPSWRAAERYSLRRRQREFFKQGAANSGTGLAALGITERCQEWPFLSG